MDTNTVTQKNPLPPRPDKADANKRNDKLAGKDFMKLLLTQLSHQDPTAPMDSEKMLAQTSQLAALETQESTNKIMKELAEQLKAQSEGGANNYALSSIGKIATMGTPSLALTNDSISTKFDLYFPKEIAQGQVTVKDSNGKTVKTFDLKSGKQGVLNFSWDGKDTSGTRVPNGEYTVLANYTDKNDVTHDVKPGTYPVEAVKFEKGKAMLKLGSIYVPMSQIKEFKQG